MGFNMIKPELDCELKLHMTEQVHVWINSGFYFFFVNLLSLHGNGSVNDGFSFRSDPSNANAAAENKKKKERRKDKDNASMETSDDENPEGQGRCFLIQEVKSK